MDTGRAGADLPRGPGGPRVVASRTLLAVVLAACVLLDGAVVASAAPRLLILGEVQADDGRVDLADLARLARDVDLVVVNLEGPLTTLPPVSPRKGWLRSAPVLAEVLARFAPGRVVGLTANNHSLDCGRAGLQQTRQVMKQARLMTAGDPAWPPVDPVPLAVTVRGGRVFILAASLIPPSTDAPAWAPQARESWLRRLVARLQALRSQGDVVVCLHWNRGESALASASSEHELAHRLVDAGASLIVGYHPHVLGPIEQTGRGLVLYSMGNLASAAPSSQASQGAAVRVSLGGAARVHPVLCGRISNGLRVMTAPSRVRRSVFDWINTLSLDFATRVEADGLVREVRGGGRRAEPRDSRP